MPPRGRTIRLPELSHAAAAADDLTALILATVSSAPSTPASLPLPLSLMPASGRAESQSRARRVHIPRPRNPFIIFRCDFVKRGVVPSSVERDHRVVSRIAGERWHQMGDSEKQKWKDLAAEEKAQHALKYPDYKYKPSARTTATGGDSRRGRSRRELEAEDEGAASRRCKDLARLIGDGIVGDHLKDVVMEGESDVAQTPILIQRRRSSSCPPAPATNHTFSRHSWTLSTPDPNFFTPRHDYFSESWNMNSPAPPLPSVPPQPTYLLPHAPQLPSPPPSNLYYDSAYMLPHAPALLSPLHRTPQFIYDDSAPLPPQLPFTEGAPFAPGVSKSDLDQDSPFLYNYIYPYAPGAAAFAPDTPPFHPLSASSSTSSGYAVPVPLPPTPPPEMPTQMGGGVHFAGSLELPRAHPLEVPSPVSSHSFASFQGETFGGFTGSHFEPQAVGGGVEVAKAPTNYRVYYDPQPGFVDVYHGHLGPGRRADV